MSFVIIHEMGVMGHQRHDINLGSNNSKGLIWVTLRKLMAYGPNTVSHNITKLTHMKARYMPEIKQWDGSDGTEDS